MRSAVRGKWLVGGVMVVGLVAASLYVLAKDYGPYQCSNCYLGAPQPDAATYNYLAKLAPSLGFRWTESGNTYIVCNAAACGYYRVTSSGDFHGDKVVKQTVTPPSGGGGGGGGGGSGGGGGGGGGGGCVASCGQGPGSGGSGTVTVGNDEKLPPKKTN